MERDKKTQTGNITVELEFDTTDHRSVLEGIQWCVLLGEDSGHILVNPDVEVLFSATPLLEGATSDLRQNPDNTELVILTGSVSGEADGTDWYTIADKRGRESGLTTVTVRLDSRDVVDFCDAVATEMAKSGECRVAEFRLGGEIVANFVSSGDNLWEYVFDSSMYSDLTGKK